MNWDLTKLYLDFDDPALEADFAEADRLSGELEALLARADHADERGVLTSVIRLETQLAAKLNRAGQYVFLTLAADADNEPAQSWYDRLRRAAVRAEQILSAWARYVGGIDDLPSVIATDALLIEHDYLLHQLEERARHTLPEAIEPAVLQMQLTGGHAWEKLRDMLDAGHTVEYRLGGETQTLTLSEVRLKAYAREAEVRKAAYEAEMAGYKAIETPMAACLSAIKGEALTLMDMKHYASVLDETLEQAHISRKALDAMLGAIEEALPMFRRYLRAKARHLGHAGGLPFYDLFAPLGAAGEGYTLDEARALLTEALGAFSPRLGALIERAFEERWIDAYPRAGKQGGAFCSDAYALGISYVLTNFDGSMNAVSTLAHELGHAYHNQQLYKNSILNSDAPMTLAETASIFNETLLTERLLARATPPEQLMLIDQELTEATQTVVDILSRYYFETDVIEARKQRSLTSKDFQRMMLDAQRRAYSDGLDDKVMHPYMWACKGHYYGPGLHFYNFPYAFGLLFGKGLYRVLSAEPNGAAERYEELLRRTTLSDAADVARGMGIDIEDRAFWRGALGLIGESVGRFEALLGDYAK
ncbi:M3 family oligoendopeptidase [Bacillota bacterium Meth-B3]